MLVTPTTLQMQGVAAPLGRHSLKLKYLRFEQYEDMHHASRRPSSKMLKCFCGDSVGWYMHSFRVKDYGCGCGKL